MNNYDDLDLDHPWTFLCLKLCYDSSDDIVAWTISATIQYIYVRNNWNCPLSPLLRGLGPARHSFHHPGRLPASVTSPSHMNQCKDSLLRYYFSTRVACVLLQVIRGATVRLPRVWGEVGYKIWEGHVFAFC